MLSGYKTYITGTLAILGFIAAWLVGEADLADTIQATVTAILAMTLRHGVSSEGAKPLAPALLLGLVFLAGCQHSPGGYNRSDIEYGYDWAQEAYISQVGTLVALKRAGEISQQDYDKTIYPLILEGNKILDAIETATLAGDESVVNSKLVMLKAIIQRMKLWVITGGPGASDDESVNGNPTPFTRTRSPRIGHLRPGLCWQGSSRKLLGAAEEGSRGIGQAGWRGSLLAGGA